MSNGRTPASRQKERAVRVSAASPARLAAAEVLLRVGRAQGHSDDLLHGPALHALSPEDRNLATALVLGVLRWQIALDAQLKPLLARPDSAIAEEIMLVLRLGAFQLLHLDRVPAHAALNESVELTRIAGHERAAGMVNAVLRKLSASTPWKQPLHESIPNLAQRLGHPAWLVERWVTSYGRPAASAICNFDQYEPSCGQLFAPASAAQLPVMDDGSRLVAELAAAAVPQPQRIWDCCAAPGGKTVVLATRHPNAEILASDASARRSKLLASRLSRHVPESKVATIVADASKAEFVLGQFDLILCDVPCSGTGTLARNPEIRHRLQPTDFPRQAKRQLAILENALQHLAPGGRLVYSTCSLEPEECEQVAAAALAAHPEFEQLTVQLPLDALHESGVISAGADLGSCVREGMLRTLPGYNLQADGFFAALFGRRASA